MKLLIAGDTTNSELYTTLLIVAAVIAIVAIVAVYLRKRKNK